MESKQTTTWYKVRWEEIIEVEVIEELPKSLRILYINGRQQTIEKVVRDSTYEKYFKTREEAKDSIINGMKNEITLAENTLKSKQLKLAKFLNSGE